MLLLIDSFTMSQESVRDDNLIISNPGVADNTESMRIALSEGFIFDLRSIMLVLYICTAYD
mgnify:CR=1 FL=1